MLSIGVISRRNCNVEKKHIDDDIEEEREWSGRSGCLRPLVRRCTYLYAYTCIQARLVIKCMRWSNISACYLLSEFDCFRKWREDRRICINGCSWQDCSAAPPVKVFLPRLKTRLVSHRFLFHRFFPFFLFSLISKIERAQTLQIPDLR